MLKKTLSIICIMLISFSIIFSSSQTTYAYKGTNLMGKYLKNYKKKNYKKMKKYVLKMKEYSEDTSLKPMSKKNKKAYLKTVKRFKKKYKQYSVYYYLADLDKDRKPELILRYDPCAAGGEAFFYTYKRKKVKKVGKIFTSQTSFCIYPGKGLIKSYGHMGLYSVTLYTMKKNKLKETYYGELNTDKLGIIDYENYLPRMMLSGHYNYLNGNYRLDYSPLK